MMRSATSVGALPLLILLLPLLCAAFVQTSFRLHGRGTIARNGAGSGNKLVPFRSRHAARAGEGTTMGLFSLFSSGAKASLVCARQLVGSYRIYEHHTGTVDWATAVDGVPELHAIIAT